jgi:hypothetical protein
VKKLLVATTFAVAVLVAFAAPVLADPPDDPGSFGRQVKEAAQNVVGGAVGPGASPEINVGKALAEDAGMPFGKFLHFFAHDVPHGIPPKHTP